MDVPHGDRRKTSSVQLWLAGPPGLRHLCATEFLRSTGNIALTAALLGHASISTTAKFYEHLDIHDLQAAHGEASVVSGVLENRRKRKA